MLQIHILLYITLLNSKHIVFSAQAQTSGPNEVAMSFVVRASDPIDYGTSRCRLPDHYLRGHPIGNVVLVTVNTDIGPFEYVAVAWPLGQGGPPDLNLSHEAPLSILCPISVFFFFLFYGILHEMFGGFFFGSLFLTSLGHQPTRIFYYKYFEG
jgi:hypothetical protein